MADFIKRPLVSVLMTAYNREKYIAEAIESVMNSTYQNWELIIVDDCSIDRTVEIAREFEQKDSRIKIYVNEKNLGDYPNRNCAASYAKGKYIKYVDADDLIYPYGLEQLVFYMEKFPEAGYGLCSLEQDVEKVFPFQLGPQETFHRHYFIAPVFHKAPLSSIILLKAFKEVGGFTGKRMLGDFEMWHLLSQKFPVVLMPHGIVWYREHDSQEMNDHKNDPLEPFKYLLLGEELIKNENCPLGNNEKTIIHKRLKKKIARSILSAFKKHSIGKGKQMKVVSKMTWHDIIYHGIIKS